MTIYSSPGLPFVAESDGPDTGLVGQLELGVFLKPAGTELSALSVDEITEEPAGSGLYSGVRTAPTTVAEPGTTYVARWSYNDSIQEEELVVTSNLPVISPKYATAEDLEARLGITLSDDDKTRAEALIASVFGLIQAESKQTISLVTDDVLTMPGTTDDRIKLPERPVQSVSSVTLDGIALTEDADYYRDGNSILRLSNIYTTGVGILDGPYLMGNGFGYPNQTLEITYTHGYDPTDTSDPIVASLRALCLEPVVRVWVNPGSVMMQGVGSTQTSYLLSGSPSGLLLTADEKKQVRRMFGRGLKSVAIQ